MSSDQKTAEQKSALVFAATLPAASAETSIPRVDGLFCPMVRRKPKASATATATAAQISAASSASSSSSLPLPTKIDHASEIAHHRNKKLAEWIALLKDVRSGKLPMRFEFPMKGTSYVTARVPTLAHRANGDTYIRLEERKGDPCRFCLFFPRPSFASPKKMDWSHLVHIQDTQKKGKRLVAARTLPRGSMFPYFGKLFKKSSGHQGAYVLSSGLQIVDGDPKLDLYGNFAMSRINEPSAAEVANCIGLDFLVQNAGKDYLFTAILVVSRISPGEELLWHYGDQYDRHYHVGLPAPPKRDVLDLTFEDVLEDKYQRPSLGEQISRWYHVVQTSGIRES